MNIKLNNQVAEEIILKGDFLLKYSFEGDFYVGISFSNSLSDVLQQLTVLKYSGQIHVLLNEQIKEIEITAFSILLLICRQSPNISVKFIFSDTKEFSSLDTGKSYDSLKNKISSFVFFAKLTAGVINLEYFDTSEEQTEKEQSKNFFHEPFPVFFIDSASQQRIHSLFTNSEKFWELKNTLIDKNMHNIFIDFDDSNRHPYELNKKYYDKVADEILQEKDFTVFHLILLTYSKCLSELRAFFLIEDSGTFFTKHEKLSAKFLRSYKEPFQGVKHIKPYYEIVTGINTRLKSKAPFYILLYCMLLSDYVTKLKRTERQKSSIFFKNLKKRSIYLFSLCDSVEKGINEIIINISQHSTEKKGVVCFKLYAADELLNLKKDGPSEVTDFISVETMDKANARFLDINVFDISRLGILETYRKKLTNAPKFSLPDIFKHTKNSPQATLEKFERNYGLLFFSTQVRNQSGYFSVSTIDEGTQILYSLNAESCIPSRLKNGTSYNVIFSLDKKRREETDFEYQNGDSKQEYFDDTENEILGYRVVEFEEYINNRKSTVSLKPMVKIDLSKQAFWDERGLQQNLIKKLEPDSSSLFPENSEAIFVFLLPKFLSTYHSNFANLFRLVSRLHGSAEKQNIGQENIGHRNIIIVSENNLVLQWFYNIYESNETQNRLAFPILFYYKENEYYKPFVLFNGSTLEIVKYNYCFLKLPEFITNEIKSDAIKSVSDIISFPESNLFYNGTKKVKEFDSLIKIGGNFLYNYFLLRCLNANVEESKNFQHQDIDFQGYKIRDGHFRLGSKIHIKDFYYAKRLFQISGIIDNLAIQTGYYLINEINIAGKLKEIKLKNLSLIGYAKYSELFIYKLKLFLQKNLPEINIIIDIFKDYESDELIYDGEIADSYIILCIPISSTFSTSFKIYNTLTNKYNIPKINILSTNINIVNVADIEFQKYKEGSSIFNSCGKLIENGWVDPQNKASSEIIVRDSTGTELTQKIILQTYTQWHSIETCSLCSLDENNENTERPLVETDKASVTPLLILGEPIKYPLLNKIENNAILDNSCYHYGHFRLDKKDNLHFITPIEFLKLNIKQINNWLEDKAEEILKKTNGRRVCLISTDGRYNSKFVHDVNKIIFKNSANIILYNAESDYISNFKEFYQEILTSSGLIIFVDDQISTGKTFASLNHYLGSCGKSFDYIIALISRVNSNVKAELENNGLKGRLLFFQQYNVPTVISSHLTCPICSLQKHYKGLASIANLDPTEYSLYKLVQKLNRKDVLSNLVSSMFHGYDSRVNETTENQESTDALKSFWQNPFENDKVVKFFIEEFIHSNLEYFLNTTFSVGENKNQEILNQIRRHFNKRTNPLFLIPYTNDQLKVFFIKVIAQSPFVNYYSIRKWVFQYLNEALDFEFDEVDRLQHLSDYRFRYIMLLLKRISNLRGNYLIRKDKYQRLFNFYKVHDKEKRIAVLLEFRTKHIRKVLNNLLQLGLNLVTLLKIADTRNEVTANLKKQFSNDFFAIASEPYKQYNSAIAEIIYGKYLYYFREEFNNIQGHLFTVSETRENIFTEIVLSCRALKNIETIIKTRSDFHYYVASLIKGITQNNEVKAIYLERNLTEWYRSVEGKKSIPLSFKQLVRIIKLENTAILKKYSDLLLSKIISSVKYKIHFEKTLTEIQRFKNRNDKDKVALTNEFYQRIISQIFNFQSESNDSIQLINFEKLFNFLNVEAESKCATDNGVEVEQNSHMEIESSPDNFKTLGTENADSSIPAKIRIDGVSNTPFYVSKSFFDFMELNWFLTADESGQEMPSQLSSLEKKIGFINNRINDILHGGVDLKSVVSTFVIYKTIDLESDISGETVTVFSSDKKISDDWTYKNSFVRSVLKGLRLRDGGGPQNIIEFHKVGVNWKSLKRYYKKNYDRTEYENNPDTYTDFLEDNYEDEKFNTGFLDSFDEANKYFKDKNHLLFFRITQMEYLEEKDVNSTTSDIKIKPQAIIVVASKKSWYYKAEKIRYLLLLKKNLSEFFRHHYENDSYLAALIEKRENLHYRDLSHGAEKFVFAAHRKHDDLIELLASEKDYYANNLLPNTKIYVSKYEKAPVVYGSNPPTVDSLKNDFETYFNLSVNEFAISAIIEKNERNTSKILLELEENNFSIETCIKAELEKKIENAGIRIAKFKDPFILNQGFNHIFDGIPKDCSFFKFHTQILDILLIELLNNAKKANRDIESKVEIKWSLTNHDEYSELSISNKYTSNNQKNQRGGYGLRMVEKIMNYIYVGERVCNDDQTNFYYSIILKFKNKLL